ncbi:hypothetical protein [Paenibacillus sp. GCM10012303]|uniref:hypothetical protein n=1 Tax=Paenibacillus sp. GCM10012303 TaxID=3317340 RepID=UPI0036101E2A
MAVYGTMVITNKGLALYAKAQSGIPLNFTRMQIGSGELSGQDPVTLTALITPIAFFAINSISSSGNTAHVKGIFENTNITVPTYTCELGLFATDPDDGEILYAYANASAQGDTIPPRASGPLSKQYQINTAIGNASNVTATIPADTYIPTTDKGVAGGVAPLDNSSKVPLVNLPGTSTATPSTLVQRDASGRFKAAAPVAADDVARKQEISEVYDQASRVATSILAIGTDLNTIVQPGFYRLQTAHPNIPNVDCEYGQMIIIRGGSDTITQMCFAYMDVTHSYIRSGNPPQVGSTGGYSAWARLMTQHGGTFTGPITANIGMILPNNVAAVNGTYTDSVSRPILLVNNGNQTVIGHTIGEAVVNSNIVPKWWNGSVVRDLLHTGGGQTIDGTTTFANATINGYLRPGSSTGVISDVTTGSRFEVNAGNPANDAYMTFHVAGNFAVNFGMSANDHRLRVGGWSLGNTDYRVWDERDLRINNGVLELFYNGGWTPVGGGGPLSELRRLGSSGTAVPQNAWTTLIDLNMRGRIEYLNFVSGGANNDDPSSHYTATYRITMDGKVVSTPAQFVTDHPGLIFTYLSNGAASTTVHVPAPIYFNQRFLLEVHFSKSGYNTTYALDYRQAY